MFVVLGLVPSSAVPSNKDDIHVASLEPTGQKNKNTPLYMPIRVCQLSVSNTLSLATYDYFHRYQESPLQMLRESRVKMDELPGSKATLVSNGEE